MVASVVVRSLVDPSSNLERRCLPGASRLLSALVLLRVRTGLDYHDVVLGYLAELGSSFDVQPQRSPLCLATVPISSRFNSMPW